MDDGWMDGWMDGEIFILCWISLNFYCILSTHCGKMVAEKLTLEEPNIVRINAVIYDEFRAKPRVA